jgi:predicted transcriptional regulator
MAESTTIRIDRATHEELKRLARERRSTVAETVARAVRILRQEQMGQDLSGPLDEAETDWLDADLR